MPPESPAAQVRGFSEGLSESVVWAAEVGPEGAPLESRTYYLHDIANSTYTRMFSEEEPVEEPALFSLGGFSADGTQMFFESGLDLAAGARKGQLNAYQWDTSNNKLSVVGILPEGEGGVAPPEGSIIGASAGASLTTLQPKPSYTQGAVSRDGSRVFFTALPSGRVYARLGQQRSVAVSPGAARFLGATPDGRYAFYQEGEALYRYDLDTEGEAPVALTVPAAGVLGTLGFSEDGRSVYFAATEVLAANANPEGEKASTGINKASLYEWHQQGAEPPITTFVASLSSKAEEFGDEGDWRDRLGADFPSLQKSARVTPDGQTLLFTSRNALTGYNSGSCVRGTESCQEVFRYRPAQGAIAASLICASCNPSGSEGISDPLLAGEGAGLTGRDEPYLTRNLSADGQRVFFQTNDALLPADTDNDALLPADTDNGTDVYEWEAEGSGTCTTHALNDGCLYLISSGTDPEQSYLGDVSANGNDVLFFTRQALAGEEVDTDSNVDLYDARIDGGPPSCEQTATCPPPPLAPCQGEGCRPAPSAPPSEPFPATASFSGPPNPTARHHHRKKKTHTKKHNKRSPGRGDADRGGRK